MRRTTFWVLISTITFIMGVGAAFVWFATKNETAATSLTTDSVTVRQIETAQLSVCDLTDDSEKYNGRIVRVKAKLNFFIHGFYFIDPHCMDGNKQIGVKFNEQRSARIEDKLDKEAKPNDYGYGMPVIVATGKFEQLTPSKQSDSIIDNVYFRFEIYEIEKVISDDIKQ